jgi:hypothetical protein
MDDEADGPLDELMAAAGKGMPWLIEVRESPGEKESTERDWVAIPFDGDRR